MTTAERPLYEIVEKLEAAWNNADSVAWTALFADDADFIHILGGHFNRHTAIERGHRAIFDTIYKGSRNKFTVQKARFLRPDVAIVFVFAELMFLHGWSGEAHPGSAHVDSSEEPGWILEDCGFSEHAGNPRGRTCS
jgi:uncharacterized protein (TIGR02246 family)